MMLIINVWLTNKGQDAQLIKSPEGRAVAYGVSFILEEEGTGVILGGVASFPTGNKVAAMDKRF